MECDKRSYSYRAKTEQLIKDGFIELYLGEWLLCAIGNKKTLNPLIIETQKQCTYESHSLTQQDIIKLFDKKYGMVL